MTLILQILLAAIFITIGIIHFYWVYGGTWGFRTALPTKENGECVLNPRKIDSAIVGLGLLSFGLFYVIKTDLFKIQIPSWIMLYGGWIIPSIFIIRAIGDFNYVGFFKKIKNTDFGRSDTKLFSPLCLIIGLFGVIIQLS